MTDERMGFDQRLLIPGGGPGYLLRDQFITDDAAPLASPRPCEPGPGTLTAVENDGTLAVSGGKLEFTAQSTPQWGDLGVYWPVATTREAGRLLLGDIKLSSGSALFACGFGNQADRPINGYTAAKGFAYFSGGNFIQACETGSYPKVGTYAYSTTYHLGVCLREAGSHLFIQGGAYAEWTLLFVYGDSTTTPLYPSLSNYAAAGALDNLRIPARKWTPTPVASDSFNRSDSTDIGSTDGAGAEESGGSGLLWTEHSGDFEIDTNRLGISAAGSNPLYAIASIDSGHSDVIVQCTGGANTYTHQICRLSDGSNFWLQRINHASGHYLYEVNAGALTLRASSVAGAYAGAHDLQMIADGETITCYMDGGDRTSYASATFNKTATRCGTQHVAVGDVLDDFVVWRRHYPEFPNV